MAVVTPPKSTPQPSSMQYSPRTLARAERGLCCSPFELKLFAMMGQTSVPLPLVADSRGQQQGYTRQPLSEQRTERELMWLIQVGLLRREVDGQGITDSFRLTPLGRQIVEKWEHQNGYLPQPSWRDQILNNLNRWFQWLV